MTYMIVRNRVADFEKWKLIFDDQEEAAQAAGLRLVNLWRGVEDSNNVFFILEVASIERAQAFLNNPQSAKVGEASGVIDVDITSSRRSVSPDQALAPNLVPSKDARARQLFFC